MACGGCGKRRAVRASKVARRLNPVMGGYKYLTDVQIKARLEIYKRKHCKSCDKKYDCTYETYVKCKNIS